MKKLISDVIELGATNASIIKTSDISTDTVFRDICKANSCGVYGKCYMCPPDCGDINEMIAHLHTYDHMLVFQTVTQLEDSYDYEGMFAARDSLKELVLKVKKNMNSYPFSKALCLGAGGCICPVCAKQTGDPCRFPDLAVSSLEAYGINVSMLAKAAGMLYNNGAATVTYFGGLLFSLEQDNL